MKLKNLEKFETLNEEQLNFIVAGNVAVVHDTNTPVKKGQLGCNDTKNNDSHIQDTPRVRVS
ncbi:hypothetical protein TPENAI_90366 [Tenacibaculum litopenaei]|jgi:hypothetical protein|uniref:hypothetical protein n=1 Tax=Tenacibaculum litopenaei TaxID=396016 RepID=UPI0038958850